MIKSKYIIFEGAEGVGKTALSQVLYQRLPNAYWTFEPYVDGDKMPISYDLRKACKLKDPTMTKMSRELMLLASRSLSLSNVVLPALREGRTVISDRSFLSGIVYAKMEGMPFEQWWALFKASELLEDVWTCIKVADAQCFTVFVMATEHRPQGGTEDRYDSRGEEFFKKLEETFMQAMIFLNNIGCTLTTNRTLYFTNDMYASIETNVERLVSEIESRGW